MRRVALAGALLVCGGCYASHERAPRAGGAGDTACAIDDGPLAGVFDGERWVFGFGQSWPDEDTVFGDDVMEPASCWPTPPRSRVFVHHPLSPAAPGHAEVAFLRAFGDLNLESPADEAHVEIIESEADWITIGVCARTDDGVYAISGRYRATRCSP